MKKRTRIFYGYWIITACLLILTIWSGSTFYSFGIFFKFIQDEFGWGRGAVATAWTMFMVVQGLGGPVTGRLIDRYGPKRIIIGGAIITGSAFALLSLTGNLWYFYAVYLMVGLGSVGLGVVPVGTLVSNWFAEKRGTALGIAATGVGLGGVFYGPSIGTFFIPTIGWRYTYLFLALTIWLIIIPLTLLIIKTRPQDIGLLPNGLKEPLTTGTTTVLAATVERWTLRQALKTTTFWLIGAGFLTTSLSTTGVFQHQVMYFTDMGIPVSVASNTIGLAGFASAAGKIIFGWLSDRLQPKFCAVISYSLQLIAIIILINLKSTVWLWIYAVLIGLGVGGWTPLSAMLISTNFGIASFGAIYGMLMVMQNLGTGTGPLIAGYWYDQTGSYFRAFVFFLALYAVAIPAILSVRRPRSR